MGKFLNLCDTFIQRVYDYTEPALAVQSDAFTSIRKNERSRWQAQHPSFILS